ncbi:MAG: hypothetical protein OEZ10_13390 [Gammaproteobacteria bacterium]|nr:hypothetical protein [Gammaproteobacteria bacterium]
MQIASLSPEERLQLGQIVLDMLDSWAISPAQQIVLLDLPPKTKPRAMKQYHDATPLPESDSTNERIEHLLGIADALRTSYPRNSQMAGFWIGQVQPRLGGRIPLEMMLQDGLEGMIAVRAHVDCAWDWHRDQEGAD